MPSHIYLKEVPAKDFVTTSLQDIIPQATPGIEPASMDYYNKRRHILLSETARNMPALVAASPLTGTPERSYKVPATQKPKHMSYIESADWLLYTYGINPLDPKHNMFVDTKAIRNALG